MPAKKHTISDEERARRIRDLARKAETDQSPRAFERAFKKVVSSKRSTPKSGSRDAP
jgi:hypothetical protein